MKVFRLEEAAAYPPGQWRERLGQARASGVSGAAGRGPGHGGPGYVAVVCIRDHWDEMVDAERDWCLDSIYSEVARGANHWNQMCACNGTRCLPIGHVRGPCPYWSVSRSRRRRRSRPLNAGGSVTPRGRRSPLVRSSRSWQEPLGDRSGFDSARAHGGSQWRRRCCVRPLKRNAGGF